MQLTIIDTNLQMCKNTPIVWNRVNLSYITENTIMPTLTAFSLIYIKFSLKVLPQFLHFNCSTLPPLSNPLFDHY